MMRDAVAEMREGREVVVVTTRRDASELVREAERECGTAVGETWSRSAGRERVTSNLHRGRLTFATDEGCRGLSPDVVYFRQPVTPSSAPLTVGALKVVHWIDL